MRSTVDDAVWSYLHPISVPLQLSFGIGSLGLRAKAKVILPDQHLLQHLLTEWRPHLDLLTRAPEAHLTLSLTRLSMTLLQPATFKLIAHQAITDRGQHSTCDVFGYALDSRRRKAFKLPTGKPCPWLSA